MRALPLALLSLLVAAAPAAAQDPIATPTATATPVVTATPSPAPVAVDGTVALAVKGAFKDKTGTIAVRGQKVEVRGRLQPAVAGQHVKVKLTQGKRTLKQRRVTIAEDGRFALTLRLKRSGNLVVRAIHEGNAQMKRAVADPVRIRSFSPSLRFGSRGPLLRLFQRKMDKLGYRISRSGVYDAATGRAVMAYRKVNSMARTESTTPGIVRNAIKGKGGYKVRYPKMGHHVEADISKQILALVDGDKLVNVYHTSSGAPATPTILGTYRFYSQTIGTNAKGMVHSNYFIRGYAIHGYASVPPYNASHGCLRVPIPNAYEIFKWINLGDRIRVDA